MVYNYASGERNGFEWSVDLDGTKGIWIVTASDGKTTRTEKFDWTHQPIWGMVDIVDSERIDEAVARLTDAKRNRLKEWFRKIFKNR